MPAWLVDACDTLNDPAGIDITRMCKTIRDLNYLTWPRHYPGTPKALEALTGIAQASHQLNAADQLKLLTLLASAAEKHNVIRRALRHPQGLLPTAMMDMLVNIASEPETYTRAERITRLSKIQEQLCWWSPAFWDALQDGALDTLDGRAVVCCMHSAATCFVDAGNAPRDGLDAVLSKASTRVTPTLAPISIVVLLAAWVRLTAVWPMHAALREALEDAVARLALEMTAIDVARVMRALAALRTPPPLAPKVRAAAVAAAARVATRVPPDVAADLLEGLVELQVPLTGALADCVYAGLRRAIPLMPDAHVPRLVAALVALGAVLEEEGADLAVALRIAVLRCLPALSAAEAVMLWRPALQLGGSIGAAAVSYIPADTAAVMRAAADAGGVGPAVWEQLVERLQAGAGGMSRVQVAEALVACGKLGVLRRVGGKLMPAPGLEVALRRVAGEMSIADVARVVHALTVASDAGVPEDFHQPFVRAIFRRLDNCEARHLVDALWVLQTLGTRVDGNLRGRLAAAVARHLSRLQGSRACALVMGAAAVRLPLVAALGRGLAGVVAMATEQLNGLGVVTFVEALVAISVDGAAVSGNARRAAVAELAAPLERVAGGLSSEELLRLLRALEALACGKKLPEGVQDSLLAAASRLAPCMQQSELQEVYALLTAFGVITPAQSSRRTRR
jgi:hypothetical protein